MKIVIYMFLLVSIVGAKVPTSTEQSSIYMEAILFVVVFGTMGIVSYIYSNKHAKEYKSVAKEEEISPFADRVLELSDMRDKDMLREDEFELLKKYYLS